MASTRRYRPSSVAVYVLVAATANSLPARTSIDSSAAAFSGESAVFVTATVSAPCFAAADVVSTRSGEPPDWLTAIHSTSVRSGWAPYNVVVDGETRPAGNCNRTSTKYFAYSAA